MCYYYNFYSVGGVVGIRYKESLVDKQIHKEFSYIKTLEYFQIFDVHAMGTNAVVCPTVVN